MQYSHCVVSHACNHACNLSCRSVESILQNTRLCEEVESPAMEEGEEGEEEGQGRREEEESMEEEPTAKVNYLVCMQHFCLRESNTRTPLAYLHVSTHFS